jgi:hypothetical protein
VAATAAAAVVAATVAAATVVVVAAAAVAAVGEVVVAWVGGAQELITACLQQVQWRQCALRREPRTCCVSSQDCLQHAQHRQHSLLRALPQPLTKGTSAWNGRGRVQGLAVDADYAKSELSRSLLQGVAMRLHKAL